MLERQPQAAWFGTVHLRDSRYGRLGTDYYKVGQSQILRILKLLAGDEQHPPNLLDL